MELEPSFLIPVLLPQLRLQHRCCSAAARAACPSGVPELKGISQAPMGPAGAQHLSAHLWEALLKALGFGPGVVCFGSGTLTQWVQGSPSPAQADVGAFHQSHCLFVMGSGWLGMRDPGTHWC